MIMKEFYHELRLEDYVASLPAVIGLTASPAENGTKKRLKSVNHLLSHLRQSANLG